MIDNQIELKGPRLLSHYEDNWETAMGACILGEGRIILRGRDLLTELNELRWSELLVFAVTGKESQTLARLVEALSVICTSFPDPRLWNNRVAALGGTTRTTGSLVVNAASTVSEADAYGVRVGKRAFDVFHRFKEKLDEGEKLEDLIKQELKNYKVVSGYGRPLLYKDERIEPLLKFAKSIGCADGPYVKLALDISDYFENSRYPYLINAAALMAALLADQGLSAEEAYYLVTQTFVTGMFPCYIDAINHPEGTLFPLSANRIDYTGYHKARPWPYQGEKADDADNE